MTFIEPTPRRATVVLMVAENVVLVAPAGEAASALELSNGSHTLSRDVHPVGVDQTPFCRQMVAVAVPWKPGSHVGVMEARYVVEA